MPKHPMAHLDEAGLHILRHLRPLRWHLLGIVCVVPVSILGTFVFSMPELLGIPDFFALGALQAVLFLFGLPTWIAFVFNLFFATGEALEALHDGRPVPGLWSGMKLRYVGVTLLKAVIWLAATILSAMTLFLGALVLFPMAYALCMRLNGWAIHGLDPGKALDRALQAKGWSLAFGTQNNKLFFNFGLGAYMVPYALRYTTTFWFLVGMAVISLLGFDGGSWAPEEAIASGAAMSVADVLGVTAFYTGSFLPLQIGQLLGLQASILTVADEQHIQTGDDIEAALTRLESRAAA